MIHGQDSWRGASIPLSILPNGVSQLKKASTVDALQISVASPLTERDYIGLNSSPRCGNVAAGSSDDGKVGANSGDLEPEDTELRLGFGPCSIPREVASGGGKDQCGNGSSGDGCNVSKNSACSLEQQSSASVANSASKPGLHQKFSANLGEESFQGWKAAFDASGAQFWPISRSSCHDAEREPGLAPGRFVIPVPKVSTVPAKRPYFEAINDSRSNYSTEIRNDARANAVAIGASGHGDGVLKFGASQAPAGQMFSWNNVIQLPTGWSIMGMEQSKALHGSMPPAMSPRAQGPPQFKAPSVGIAQTTKESLAKTPSLPVKQTSIEAQNDDGGSRAPVVGWPPIRSFRKNTLAAQPKPNAEDHDQANAEASDQGKPASSSSTLFVKAKLDGVKIGRKVDLKSYDSYDSLKLALQEMFRGFVNGGSSSSGKSENSQLDLLHSSDYVLTHEDNDGDCMLAGDVPWETFVTTVKSLRIMKGADAAGQGQKASKLKIQAKNEGKESGMEKIIKVEK